MCFSKPGVFFGDALFLVKHVNFPTKVLKKFLSSELKISSVTFKFEFLISQLTGANIAGPVFLPKNICVEQGCYWSFEFSIFSFHQRRSHSPIVSMIDFQHSIHLVVCSFHIFIHYPNQVIDFQLSNFFLDLSFHCGKNSLFHLLQIMSTYACDTLNALLSDLYIAEHQE